MSERIEDEATLPDGPQLLFDQELPPVLGGRYTLEERLGVGGGAVVWRAFDEALSRTVAMKLLRPGRSRDREAVSRLQHEASTAGRVPHPGIVAVYDTGTDDDVAWLAIEHVAGPTLLQVLRHHPTGLPPAVAAAVAEQVAVALGHAHARGLVHRDVKPSNLLLSPDGVVKLADFGVAADLTAGAVARPAGSRRYAAPEQLRGGDGADRPPVDVHALGVVLHECLTGRPAFTGRRGRDRQRNGLAADDRELLAPRQVRPDVPRDLDALVQRATRRDPAQRFADGTELAAALRPLVDSDPMELTRTLLEPGPNGDAVAARPGRRRTTPDTDEPVGSAADTTSGWRWIAAAAAVLSLVVTLAVLQGGGTTPGSSPETVVADAGVPVRTVELFDPYGSVGADATRPLAAVDADAGTAWTTPGYPVPLRSLGSAGVGIWLDVGEPRSIDAVELDLRTGAVTVELLAADSAPSAGTTEADWDSLDRRTRPGERARLDAGGTRARYWLVWFTDLQSVGETWQAALTDLRFTTTGTS